MHSIRAQIALSVLLAFLLLPACNRGPKEVAKKDTGPVKVRVAPVRMKTLVRNVESIGTLFPFDEAVISAEIDGRIVEVNSDLGDAVTQGQVLAKISDEEQNYIVAQQDAQLRQSLERLGLKDEKDRVKDIRETPDVRRAQADLFEAEQVFKRTKRLVDEGIGARSDLDAAQARLQSAQATYDATLNQTRNLIQEVERFKASLELQRKKLRDTTLRAPFAAFVKDRQVTAGQYVRANAPMFTLVKIDPIRLRIEVPERMAPWVKVGQKAEVKVEAFGERSFEGKIWRISPTVEPTKRTFIVEALIRNENRELKPGSYAKAVLVTDKAEQVRIIPSRALTYILGSNKAYVVKSDDTVEARDVKLGERLGEDVEVLEGLTEGERVAVGQLNRLDTGAKVMVTQGVQASVQ